MKLQHLAIIFLVIVFPIIFILSVYLDYHIDAINLKYAYDTKLLDATYDALKSYQMNTVNNAISDISASKIDDLEAAVKTFYNALTTSFGYTGYNSSVMKDYVPAVVFAMYDGYYIYSPYRNVLTGVPRIVDSDGDGTDDSNYVDEDYEDNKILSGLKPYVYYSCRYKIDDNNDFVITYTLDNYITVQGTVNGIYVNKYGYLIDGITKVDTDEYEYDGIAFKKNGGTENLKEYLGDKEYSYAKLNGTKYYLDEKGTADLSDDEIFYINVSGERAVQASVAKDATTFNKYKDFIKGNNSAYKYYRDAYEFTTWVRENLGSLNSGHAVDATTGNSITTFAPYTVFGTDEDTSDKITSGPESTKYIQDADSDFNAHRSDVIRYTITKNLSTAIAGYNNYFENSESDFIMPNISETDWEIIENNISIITFLQGFKIGGRDYNKYSVVANNLTKEYIDEKDIYILCNDKTYYKINDKVLLDGVAGGSLTLAYGSYQPGIWKLNFESRIHLEEDAATGNYVENPYYPISYWNGTKKIPYIGSYSSIITSTSLDNSESDVYKYLRNGLDTNGDGVGDTPINDQLKKAYYTALARERYGRYSVNHDVNIINLLS